MQVVTVWTQERKCLLEASCEKFGIPLLVTQKLQPWQDLFIHKIKNLYSVLKWSNADAFLFIDGHDAFVTTERMKFISDCVLSDSKMGLVVSGERNCFPWPNRHKHLINGVRTDRFPNAGVWMGYRDKVFAFMEWCLWIYNNPSYTYSEENGGLWTWQNCDQNYWCEALTLGMCEVGPANWCMNLYNVSDSEISTIPQWKFIPSIIHGSGPQYKTKVIDLCRAMLGRIY